MTIGRRTLIQTGIASSGFVLTALAFDKLEPNERDADAQSPIYDPYCSDCRIITTTPTYYYIECYFTGTTTLCYVGYIPRFGF
jgi:hypothetical protein